METPFPEVDDHKHQKFLKMFDFKPQSLVQNPQTLDFASSINTTPPWV